MSILAPAATKIPPGTRRLRRFRFVITTALVTFVGLFGALGYQMRTGHDPALAGTAVALVAHGHTTSPGTRLVTSSSGVTRAVPITAASHGHGSTTIVVTTHTSAHHGDD